LGFVGLSYPRESRSGTHAAIDVCANKNDSTNIHANTSADGGVTNLGAVIHTAVRVPLLESDRTLAFAAAPSPTVVSPAWTPTHISASAAVWPGFVESLLGREYRNPVILR
jgi:hypothetical protein